MLYKLTYFYLKQQNCKFNIFVEDGFLIMQIIRNVTLFLIFAPIVVFANNKFDAKIAVVDVESILEHSVAMKEIKKSISIISENIQNELSKKEKALKLIETDLVKQRSSLKEKEFNQKVNEFNHKVSITQKEMQDKKSNLEIAYSLAMQEVHKVTISIISELSKKNNFNIVLPSAQVLFVKNSLNITPEVITGLNKKLKNVKIKYDSNIVN